MTPTTILFDHKVCGTRTAEVIGYTSEGLPICQISKWKFAFNGRHRILAEGEAIPVELPEPKPEPTTNGYTLALQPYKRQTVTRNAASVERENLKACSCGCGGQTASLFVPGHDMRVKAMIGKIKKGQITLADLPQVTQHLLTTSTKWKERLNG